jgi:hypothetical protein
MAIQIDDITKDKLGASFIGAFVSCVLFGIAAASDFVYFDRFGTKDRLPWRVMVGLVLVADGLDVVFICSSSKGFT